MDKPHQSGPFLVNYIFKFSALDFPSVRAQLCPKFGSTRILAQWFYVSELRVWAHGPDFGRTTRSGRHLRNSDARGELSKISSTVPSPELAVSLMSQGIILIFLSLRSVWRLCCLVIVKLRIGWSWEVTQIFNQRKCQKLGITKRVNWTKSTSLKPSFAYNTCYVFQSTHPGL